MLKHRLKAKSAATLKLLRALVMLTALQINSTNASLAQQKLEKSKDNIVDIVTSTEPTQIKVYAFSQQVSEGAVLMEVTGQNISTIPSNPRWSYLSRSYNDPVVIIQLPGAGQTYNYKFKYQYHSGLPGGHPDLKYVYKLPIKPDQAIRVNLGYGEGSHAVGTVNEFAIDLATPEGTPVCAARDGVVIAFRSDSNIGGPGAEYLESANHVTIKHADGSYAEYVHLKQNGVLVRLNEHVKKGQIIALSGNTGQSTGPHLHFCIYYYDQNEIRHSVPFYMLTKNGPTKVFTVGKLLQP